MAEEYPLDEWGHVESTVVAKDAVAGVMPGPGGIGRLVYSRNGDPTKGYDRVYWYASVEAAVGFLRRWDGMSKPEGFIRDLQTHPIDWRAETG